MAASFLGVRSGKHTGRDFDVLGVLNRVDQVPSKLSAYSS